MFKFISKKTRLMEKMANAIFHAIDEIADLKGYDDMTDDQFQEVLRSLFLTNEDYEEVRKVIEREVLR